MGQIPWEFPEWKEGLSSLGVVSQVDHPLSRKSFRMNIAYTLREQDQTQTPFFAKTLHLQKRCFGNASENAFSWAVVARFIECLYNSNI